MTQQVDFSAMKRVNSNFVIITLIFACFLFLLSNQLISAQPALDWTYPQSATYGYSNIPVYLDSVFVGADLTFRLTPGQYAQFDSGSPGDPVLWIKSCTLSDTIIDPPDVYVFDSDNWMMGSPQASSQWSGAFDFRTTLPANDDNETGVPNLVCNLSIPRPAPFTYLIYDALGGSTSLSGITPPYGNNYAQNFPLSVQSYAANPYNYRIIITGVYDIHPSIQMELYYIDQNGTPTVIIPSLINTQCLSDSNISNPCTLPTGSPSTKFIPYSSTKIRSIIISITLTNPTLNDYIRFQYSTIDNTYQSPYIYHKIIPFQQGSLPFQFAPVSNRYDALSGWTDSTPFLVYRADFTTPPDTAVTYTVSLAPPSGYSNSIFFVDCIFPTGTISRPTLYNLYNPTFTVQFSQTASSGYLECYAVSTIDALLVTDVPSGGTGRDFSTPFFDFISSATIESLSTISHIIPEPYLPLPTISQIAVVSAKFIGKYNFDLGNTQKFVFTYKSQAAVILHWGISHTLQVSSPLVVSNVEFTSSTYKKRNTSSFAAEKTGGIWSNGHFDISYSVPTLENIPENIILTGFNAVYTISVVFQTIPTKQGDDFILDLTGSTLPEVLLQEYRGYDDFLMFTSPISNLNPPYLPVIIAESPQNGDYNISSDLSVIDVILTLSSKPYLYPLALTDMAPNSLWRLFPNTIIYPDTYFTISYKFTLPMGAPTIISPSPQQWAVNCFNGPSNLLGTCAIIYGSKTPLVITTDVFFYLTFPLPTDKSQMKIENIITWTNPQVHLSIDTNLPPIAPIKFGRSRAYTDWATGTFSIIRPPTTIGQLLFPTSIADDRIETTDLLVVHPTDSISIVLNTVNDPGFEGMTYQSKYNVLTLLDPQDYTQGTEIGRWPAQSSLALLRELSTILPVSIGYPIVQLQRGYDFQPPSSLGTILFKSTSLFTLLPDCTTFIGDSESPGAYTTLSNWKSSCSGNPSLYCTFGSATCQSRTPIFPDAKAVEIKTSIPTISNLDLDWSSSPVSSQSTESTPYIDNLSKIIINPTHLVPQPLTLSVELWYYSTTVPVLSDPKLLRVFLSTTATVGPITLDLDTFLDYPASFFRVSLTFEDNVFLPAEAYYSSLFNILSVCMIPDTSSNPIRDPFDINSYTPRCPLPGSVCRPQTGLCSMSTLPPPTTPTTPDSCTKCNTANTELCTGGANATPTCTCKTGWTGLTCDQNEECSSITDNTLRCITTNGFINFDQQQSTCTGIASCKCYNEWAGSRCQTCSKICYNDGVIYKNCDRCGCKEGYTGSDCKCQSVTGTLTFGASNPIIISTNGQLIADRDAQKMISSGMVSTATASQGAKLYVMNHQNASIDLSLNAPLPTGSPDDDYALYLMMREIWWGLQNDLLGSTSDVAVYSMTVEAVKNDDSDDDDDNDDENQPKDPSYSTIFTFTIVSNCPESNPQLKSSDQVKKQWEIFVSERFVQNVMIKKYFSFDSKPSGSDLTPTPETLPSPDDTLVPIDNDGNNSSYSIHRLALLSVLITLITVHF